MKTAYVCALVIELFVKFELKYHLHSIHMYIVAEVDHLKYEVTARQAILQIRSNGSTAFYSFIFRLVIRVM